MATGVSFSDYAENRIGESIIRGAAFVQPAALYVALFTSATVLTDLGGGTEVSTSGSGYSRKQIPEPRTGAFSAFSSGQSSNLTLIDFGTATTTWGNIQYLALFDAVTLGNMWMYGTITGAPKAVNSGQPVKINVGAIVVAID